MKAKTLTLGKQKEAMKEQQDAATAQMNYQRALNSVNFRQYAMDRAINTRSWWQRITGSMNGCEERSDYFYDYILGQHEKEEKGKASTD